MRLIDADALIESIGVSDAVKWGNKDGYQQDRSYSTLMRYEIKDYIDSQPTVDAVPVKHGQWIPVLNGIDDDTNPAFDCSECDAMCNKKHNYCPVCGTKMDLTETV